VKVIDITDKGRIHTIARDGRPDSNRMGSAILFEFYTEKIYDDSHINEVIDFVNGKEWVLVGHGRRKLDAKGRCVEQTIFVIELWLEAVITDLLLQE
jgi:hypothetical protein